VSHQLIGFFRGRIQATWVVDGLLPLRMAGKRFASIGPNFAGRVYTRCSMPWGGQPSRIERKAHHIAVHIGPAGFQLSSETPAWAGQMDHPLQSLERKQFGDGAVLFQGQPRK